MAGERRTLHQCERCHGEGRIGFFGLFASIECPACNGTGHVAPHPMREPTVDRLRPQAEESDLAKRFREAREREFPTREEGAR